MLIGDGVTPGNEGRGYVLRRLLRRVVRSMRLLGVDEPMLPELLPVSRDKMRASYPELEPDSAADLEIAYAEEEAFRHTLAAGPRSSTSRSREAKREQPDRADRRRAFQLHDTYGFPIDLTLEMAAEQGLAVDEDGFRRLMKEQRDRAKADAKAKKTGPRHRGLPRAARRRAERVHRLHRGGRRELAGPRPLVDGEPVERPRPATTSRSCSTAPRSTPRAAASWPTPGRITGDGARARGPRRAAPGQGPDRAPGPDRPAASWCEGWVSWRPSMASGGWAPARRTPALT